MITAGASRGTALSSATSCLFGAIRIVLSKLVANALEERAAYGIGCTLRYAATRHPVSAAVR
jgi:hypothetical protein